MAVSVGSEASGGNFSDHSGGLWYRVQAVLAAGLGGTPAADYAAVLPAALNAARHRRPFIAGWLSRGGGSPLELITTAGPLPPAVPSGDTRPTELLFPWGARGVPLGGGMLADLDKLVWAPCPGRLVADAAYAGQTGSARVLTNALPVPGQFGREQGNPVDDGTGACRFESALEMLMGRPFGWLIVADPTDQLEPELAELRHQLTVLRQYDDELSRSQAMRAQHRLAELDLFGEAGLWQVRVLAGASTKDDLQAIAPVLVGSVDLGTHSARLRCPDDAHEFADALAVRHSGENGAMVPFSVTAGTLAALTGVPRREVPGVRVMRPGSFDVTSETSEPAGATEPAIDLGQILDGQDRPVGTLRVPLATINRHALIVGATGAGKSQTVRHLLEQLSAAGVNWLAVEPVKTEYAAMAGRLPAGAQVAVINPADPQVAPMSVNPLAPEPGFAVQAHIDMVRALFLAAYEAREPFPQIMAQALERVYADCGWDPLTGGSREGLDVPPSVPTLAGLQTAALTVIDEVGYGQELRADMRGFVGVRLRSLRSGAAGRFFEGGHPADIGALLRGNVVLALEDVANDEDKAFIIGTLIIRITEHLRLRARTSPAAGLGHVIVIEEAHRLLRAGRDGASAHAVELFASLLAEIRAYGEGIVIAEQIPAKLVPDAVKNTALKVVHRLPAADDRQLVGATMNLDDGQSRQVVAMPPGQAAVFADGMDRPVRVKVPFGGDREQRPGATADPPLAGRRSAACGKSCTSGRPCTLVEMRAADIVATSQPDAWLRVWSEVFVLAHLVNRPRPRVPVPLRERWAGLAERLRECALATTVEHAVAVRSRALRESFDPSALSAACAASAAVLLDGGPGAGTLPGPYWVIPQLRWLHELEQVCPIDGSPADPFAVAPRLDYQLSGLAGLAEVKVGQRISGLRRHPLSMEISANRFLAWTALLGEDDQAGFIDDLAAVAIGVSHRGQLRKAAGEMGVTGWLEAVLSWPRRFIVGADELPAALTSSEASAIPG